MVIPGHSLGVVTQSSIFRAAKSHRQAIEFKKCVYIALKRGSRNFSFVEDDIMDVDSEGNSSDEVEEVSPDAAPDPSVVSIATF